MSPELAASKTRSVIPCLLTACTAYVGSTFTGAVAGVSPTERNVPRSVAGIRASPRSFDATLIATAREAGCTTPAVLCWSGTVLGKICIGGKRTRVDSRRRATDKSGAGAAEDPSFDFGREFPKGLLTSSCLVAVE